jgi:hypothetical protein
MTNVIIGQYYKGSKIKANAHKPTPTIQDLVLDYRQGQSCRFQSINGQ